MLSRRRLLQGAAVLPLAPSFAAAGAPIAPASRVRPRDLGGLPPPNGMDCGRGWKVNSLRCSRRSTPVGPNPDGDACRALFKELKNPYFIGDSPALTQTCGWVDAWTAQPSVYAVAARKTAHVVARSILPATRICAWW